MFKFPNMTAADLNVYFHGCCFRTPKGEVGTLQEVTREVSVVHMLEGSGDMATNVRAENVRTDELIRNVGWFSFPPLGWRSIAKGTLLMHCRLNAHGGGRRGFYADKIDCMVPMQQQELCYEMGLDLRPLYTPLVQFRHLWNTTHVPLKEGIKGMLDGELFGFSMSNNVAVGINLRKDCDRFPGVLYYDRREVALLHADGKFVPHEEFKATLIRSELKEEIRVNA